MDLASHRTCELCHAVLHVDFLCAVAGECDLQPAESPGGLEALQLVLVDEVVLRAAAAEEQQRRAQLLLLLRSCLPLLQIQ